MPRDDRFADLTPTARVVRRVLRQQASLLPAWLIALGGIVAAVDAAALHLGLLQPLPSLLPIDPDVSEQLTAGAVAIGLFGVAIGLARRKRVAWWLALVILACALVAQIALLRHLSGAVLAGLSLTILVVDRRRYRVETGTRSRRIAIGLWGIGSLAAIAAAATAVGATTHAVHPAPDSARWIDAVVSWLAFGDPGLASGHGVSAHLLITASLLARMSVVLGVVLALAPAEAPRRSELVLPREADAARRYGQGALLPFQMGPDTRRYSLAGHRAVISFGLDGRTAVILGEPIGSDAEARATLERFMGWCEQNDWRVACYQASGGGRAPFLGRRFLAYRIGREAILDLPTFELSGSERANVRHSVTRARRGGLQVEWYPRGLRQKAHALRSELDALDEAWMAGRPAIRFTVSAYRIPDLQRLPLALGRAPSGAIECLVTFRSTGRDGGHVLDLVRRRPGAIPGCVEACLVEAAQRFGASGARTLSLGLAPLAGLSPTAGSPVERALGLGARALRGAYDIAGLTFFKAKFAPRWEQRYLVVERRAHLPAVLLALLRLHLGGSGPMLEAGLRLALHELPLTRS